MAAKPPWLTVHPLSPEDSLGATALRASVAAFKGKLAGTAARGPFDAVMERVAAPAGVTFEADTVGGISGWWAKPARPRNGAAIIHVHGGWFNLGTASAYRNFVGHIASSAGAEAFIPEYRLAPEHRFPAAVEDVEACYRGLVGKGINQIAVTGDSAGGDLALALLSIACAPAYKGGTALVGAVAISPVTDLALTGESFETRAEADPYFTRSQVAGLVASYPRSRWRRRSVARRLPPLRGARRRGGRRRRAGRMDGNAARLRHRYTRIRRGSTGTQGNRSLSDRAAAVN